MSGTNEKKIKYCVYCGTEIKSGEIYCPKCGKLNIQLKSNENKHGKKEKEKFQRTCSGCGSIIASNKLQQCPICNTLLEKVPENLVKSSQEKPGYIFDWHKSNKLQPEINKEQWNLKEGLQVFEFSILFYLMFITTIFLFIQQLGENFTDNIFTIQLQLIPYIILGIYPLFYIISKKNKFIKLGFDSRSRNIILAVLIGIFGGITLFIFDFISNFIFNGFISMGFQGFVNYGEQSVQTQQIVQNSGPWIFLYLVTQIVTILSIEMAYRGVLHKSLKIKFGNSISGKIYVILIVALIYTMIESLFLSFIYIYVSLFFFIYYFLIFIIIGILFEINGNIYNAIIAHIFFKILVIITIIYF